MGIPINGMDSPNNDPPFPRNVRPDVLLTDGGERAPQLNDANISCHCACRRSSNEAEDGLVSDDSQVIYTMDAREVDEDIIRDAGMRESDEAQVDGEEGIEGPLIELGSYGLVPLELIWRSLARHNRCTCHVGVLPGSDDYPFVSGYNTQIPSGFQSSHESLAVEVDGSEHGMSSSQAFSNYSRNSSVLFQVGAGLQPFPIIYNPLRLTEEVPFEYPPEFGEGASSQFSISRAEFVEYNLR